MSRHLGRADGLFKQQGVLALGGLVRRRRSSSLGAAVPQARLASTGVTVPASTDKTGGAEDRRLTAMETHNLQVIPSYAMPTRSASGRRQRSFLFWLVLRSLAAAIGLHLGYWGRR